MAPLGPMGKAPEVPMDYVCVNKELRRVVSVLVAVDYSVVPWCTYTDPEVARVGLSEEEAQAQNVPTR